MLDHSPLNDRDIRFRQLLVKIWPVVRHIDLAGDICVPLIFPRAPIFIYLYKHSFLGFVTAFWYSQIRPDFFQLFRAESDLLASVDSRLISCTYFKAESCTSRHFRERFFLRNNYKFKPGINLKEVCPIVKQVIFEILTAVDQEFPK